MHVNGLSLLIRIGYASLKQTITVTPLKFIEHLVFQLDKFESLLCISVSLYNLLQWPCTRKTVKAFVVWASKPVLLPLLQLSSLFIQWAKTFSQSILMNFEKLPSSSSKMLTLLGLPVMTFHCWSKPLKFEHLAGSYHHISVSVMWMDKLLRILKLPFQKTNQSLIKVFRMAPSTCPTNSLALKLVKYFQCDPPLKANVPTSCQAPFSSLQWFSGSFTSSHFCRYCVS